MRAYAESTIFSNVPNVDGSAIVVDVPSKSNPKKFYRVDLTHGRCDCPAWKFKSPRAPCKHLTDLGYYDIQVDAVGNPIAQPTAPKQKTPLTEEQKAANKLEIEMLDDFI